MTPAVPGRSLGVLHVCGDGGWHGRAMQALELVDRLAARGHAPVLAAPRHSPLASRAAARGVETVLLPPRGPTRWIALRRLMAAGGCEAVHLHGLGDLSAAARAAIGLAAPPPFVLAVGGDVGYGDRALPRGAPLGRVAYFWAASEWVRSALVRAGIDEPRIAVIHAGVDLDRFSPPPDGGIPARGASRAAMGLGADDVVIGTVARLSRDGGVDRIIEACRMIRAGEPPPGERRARLLVVGDGPRRAALGRCASRAGLSDAVVFTGWADDVPGMLAAMDVYVHPAVSGNGFPVSLLEALAAGLPAVATDLMGIREIADNGRHALIVPPGDAPALALNIMRLLRDPDLARRLGRGGNLKVQRYGLKAMVDRAEALYFRLVR